MFVTFLGTSSMVPTKDRNNSSIFVNLKDVNILLDCGENTQRQFKIAGISLSKIDFIFISHWHGDHCLGLPGIIQTLGQFEYSKTLHIYGPKDSKKYVNHILKSCIFENKIDETVKKQFVRFGKGKYEHRALIEIKIGKNVSIKTSYEFCNDLVKSIAEFSKSKIKIVE